MQTSALSDLISHWQKTAVFESLSKACKGHPCDMTTISSFVACILGANRQQIVHGSVSMRVLQQVT